MPIIQCLSEVSLIDIYTHKLAFLEKKDIFHWKTGIPIINWPNLSFIDFGDEF